MVRSAVVGVLAAVTCVGVLVLLAVSGDAGPEAGAVELAPLTPPAGEVAMGVAMLLAPALLVGVVVAVAHHLLTRHRVLAS